MISIIICARSSEISQKLCLNIEKTIGFAFELIVINNSENKFSIYEAYNLGITTAKGNYWCFVHEDVLFHTQNWGRVISDLFEEHKKAGLIGIAGTKLKTKMPSAWWDCPEKFKVMNLIQHRTNSSSVRRNCGWTDKSEEEVAIIDGVFMVGRTIEGCRFDERLHGFHNYDINLSLIYKSLGYKVFVSDRILIEHFSNGKIDENWYRSTLQFDNLYRKSLPVVIDNCVNDVQKYDVELYNGLQFFNGLIKYEFRYSAAKCWVRLCMLNPFMILNRQLLSGFFK